MDSILHVIIIYFNYCNYDNRLRLTRDFIQRMMIIQTIEIHVIELTFNGDLHLADGNFHYLALESNSPMWYKENMINVAVQKMLPIDWKYMAWIDADLDFDNDYWSCEAISSLQDNDVIQLFSHCDDLDANREVMHTHTSFVYRLKHDNQYTAKWHPGYAWAMTRKCYEKIGGLFESNIAGGGDRVMALSFIQKLETIRDIMSDSHYNHAMKFQDRCIDIKIDYLRLVIRHYYHGDKKNRLYKSRHESLIEFNYNPKIMLEKDKDGILIPSIHFPIELLHKIKNYFYLRNEDDGCEKKNVMNKY